jgi:integrase/recombinase XerD
MLLDDYLEYLKSTEGKSSGTIIQYQNSLKLFMKYMKEDEFSLTRESIKKIKISHIYGFLATISETNAGGSRRNKISALKSFFEYCKEIELLKHNIIVDIKKQPKTPRRIPKYFNLEECKTLINSVGKRNLIRDKMIIILFLSTGLRLTELINLDVSCIIDNNLTIIGKGNKERPVYLNDKIIILLKEYLVERGESKSNALFLSERNNRISKSAVQNLLRNAIERAGLKLEGETDVLVHVLRHSFATNEYQNGTDIRLLQELLGHEDIGTTQIYTHVNKKQMVKQAENSIMSSII